VPPEAALLDVGRALVEGGSVLGGVMTHAGSSYDLDTPAALEAMAEQERAAACTRPSACAPPACLPGGQRRLHAHRARRARCPA
jgi:hypothetical protein